MRQPPKSVLFVSSRADRGAGGETYLLRVLRYLDAQRFRPHVLLPREGSLTEDLDRLDVGWTVVDADHGWLRQSGPWYRLLAGCRARVERILELISREGVDLVHTNSNHRIEGALAASLAGVHHLYLGHIEYQHDMPVFQRFPLAPASYARLMGELSSRVVTVSRSVADTLTPWVPADRLEVIHNGLELDTLDAAATAGGCVRTELGLAVEAVLVSAVGRLNPDKGFDYLVEAADRVLRRDPECHFLLIGGDEVHDHAETLRARVTALGIGTRFHFLGFRTDVPAILRQSDVFVLSSRREGHPYVLLEAMGCGCAAVASRCAGVDETLVPGETGFAAQIGDVEVLADGIAALVADPDLRRRMGNAARRRVEQHFQAGDMVRKLMDAYDTALAVPLPPAGAPAVDLFLNATSEIGRLGSELEEVKTRLNTLEGRVEPLLSNLFTTGLKRLRRLVRGGSES